ncbi:hypothetical protein [Klebsiella pneumoniae]|uniref:hypothetical protein n=1 Tax=Klebsiella pneumoniae TaxID=573 RepID=UPI00359D9D7D
MIEAELLRKLIKEIDDDLCSSGVPILQREFDCTAFISKKLNINLPLFVSKGTSSLSEGHKISFIISEWYKEMYGDRLNINTDLGYILLLIRKDLMICRIPNFAGECAFFIEEDLSLNIASNETNILLMIDGMTQSFANSLSDDEKEMIFLTFMKGLKSSVIIADWFGQDIDMINAAINDWASIKSNLKLRASHLGNAKWSYSQFIEKIVKAWLLKAGLSKSVVRKFNHHIDDASSKFNDIYKEKIDIDMIKNIKGDAGLRYDEIIVTPEELIKIQDDVLNVIIAIGHTPTLQSSFNQG